MDILNDPWLPDEENPYVVTNYEALKGYKVSSLFDINHSLGDRDLLADMF